jgi:hypothetical protein
MLGAVPVAHFRDAALLLGEGRRRGHPAILPAAAVRGKPGRPGAPGGRNRLCDSMFFFCS